MKIFLAGNPNSGKSSLFNALTGLRQKTANFPGVTVEKHVGLFKSSGQTVAEITDLPGTYSLFAKSPDEEISVQELLHVNPVANNLVLVVADAVHLKRSLYFTTQCIDAGLPVVLVLNMMDQAKERNVQIDLKSLEAQMGIAVAAVSLKTGEGLKELKDLICQRKEKPLPNASAISILPEHVYQQSGLTFRDAVDAVATSVKPLKNTALFKYQTEEAVARYRRIEEILKISVSHLPRQVDALTRRVDAILTHKIWGYLIFAAILFLIFQFIFSVSAYPMEWIEQAFAELQPFISKRLPSGIFNDLLCNGLLAGISGVVVFIPQIALLFGFIALLEDSGYMARVSFIMDRLMRKFGMNGRSVIPLMSGVACAVPAIMGSRTIQNRKERLITILVTPLMSCSARLPVYTLLISLVIPSYETGGWFNLQGLVLMGLYILGFVAAMLLGLLLKLCIKNAGNSHFIMEMPVYRMPGTRHVLLTMFDKVKIFLFDAGKIIIAIAVVMWALSQFGPEKIRTAAEKDVLMRATKETWTESRMETELNAVRLETSYAGVLGKHIEPFIRPLGFDWKIGISLITSFAAREVFVGTMATIYSVHDPDDTRSVRQKMREEIDVVTGKPVYNFATGISLMLFYALAMQCMSTVAVVYRESGSILWAIGQFMLFGLLAYLAALSAYTMLS